MPNQFNNKPYSLGLPLVGLAISYFITGRLGTWLVMPPGYSTALFPASGIALFAILRYGYKVWPGILIGSFLLNGSISVLQQNLSLIKFIPIGLSIGLGACGEALLGAYFLYRFTKSSDPFYQVKNVFIFIVFSSGISSLISAACGTSTVMLSGLGNWDQFNETFLTWWLGDAIGILVITPILIVHSTLPSNRFHPKLMREGIFLVISLIIVCKIVFANWSGDSHYPLAYLPFPFLVWAVFRFDKLGVTVPTLVISIISIWETINGNGPFAIHQEPNKSLLLLQTFLGVASTMTLTLFTDLTEKRRISDSLKKAEEQLKQTENFSLVMTTHVGLNGSWLKFPSTICDLLGYTREEMMSMKFETITHPDDLEADLHQCQRLIRGEIKSFDMEKRYIHKDGHIIWVYLNASIVLDGDKNPLHFLSYIRDITERKNLEEALKRHSKELEDRVQERTLALERSNQDLEEFAYLASHDMQEPLRKIITFSDRLIEKEDSLNEEAKGYLSRMKKAAFRMSNYISDLLEYSKVTQQPKKYERVSLKKLVIQVIEDLSHQIKNKNATINMGELPTLEVDPIQFPKAIQNLISNALKYHREDLPPIISITSIFLGKIKKWQIEVSDNGIGIDDKYYNRIFKPFERLHGRSEFEGSGIGLAICQKIIDRHNGTITVQKNLPFGTTFVITLPEKQKPS